MKKFFIHNGVKEDGPFTLDELSLKHINANTPIWYDGLENWTIAKNVQELQPLLVKNSTPPPFRGSTATKSAAANGSGKEEGVEKKSRTWWYVGAVVFLAAFFAYSINKTDDSDLPPQVNESVAADSIIPTEPVETKIPETENVEQQKLDDERKKLRDSWGRYLWAEAGDYESNELGGISNLEVVVVNKMEYPIDEAKVAVKYIKENGDSFKTEYVIVYNIPAGGKASMPAPDSNRGTKVEMEITGARCQSLNFCYDVKIDTRGVDDPYFCR